MVLAVILIALLGCSDQSQVTLEFRLAEDESAPGLTEIVFNPPGMSVYLHDEVVVDETDVDSAFVTAQNGRPAIELLLTPEGSRKFEELTGQNVGKRCAMILNGKVESAPRIMARISAGRAIVAGSFSEPEARRIASALSQQ
jgi:preprotein translocase subunit SecD